MINDPIDYGFTDGDLGCALPDLGRIIIVALAGIVVVAAIGLALWQRVRA